VCGRFTLTSTPEALAERFDLSAALRFEPRYNIAPGQDILAIREGEGGRRATPLRWGLVPRWAKDPAVGNRMINARMETVGEKPAFRDAFLRRRCLVPADGFYEWAPADHGKQPHHIHQVDHGLFAMAALWEQWADPAGGTLESCTLLTRPACAPVSELHDRMPVILEAGLLEAWLDPERVDPDEILPLIAQDGGPELVHHPVSRRVNQPAWDVPACLEPVEAAPRQQGLFS
jgi:putative SOS response-associated peptidase YedK